MAYKRILEDYSLTDESLRVAKSELQYLIIKHIKTVKPDCIATFPYFIDYVKSKITDNLPVFDTDKEILTRFFAYDSDKSSAAIFAELFTHPRFAFIRCGNKSVPLIPPGSPVLYEDCVPDFWPDNTIRLQLFYKDIPLFFIFCQTAHAFFTAF